MKADKVSGNKKAADQSGLTINLFFNNIRNLHLIVAAVDLLCLHFQSRSDAYFKTANKSKKSLKRFSKQYLAIVEKVLKGKATNVAIDLDDLQSVEVDINSINSEFATGVQNLIVDAIKEIVSFTKFLEEQWPKISIHGVDLERILSELATTKALFDTRDQTNASLKMN